ncbi:hypothetical protein KCMC57_64190 (plasmid) [Kitasatospora sp. CMC57]|uniref:Cysteine-rich CPCC domain-containing protein n=1 Tax=Kitasatospora sp. CMC57 TaxID=3231513 RepID=A0AB33K826_9ACTN
MVLCECCGQPCPWTPFGACCSWDCFDRDRSSVEEQQAMVEAAPEAFAFFMGLPPGERIE